LKFLLILWFKKKIDIPEGVLVILSNLSYFVSILNNPPKLDPIETTFGKLDPPLGCTRLKIIEFFVQLFRIGSIQVENELIKLNVIETITELVFIYEHNNFLHYLFLTLVTFILGGDSSDLKKSLFLDCKICSKIIKGFQENKKTNWKKFFK